MTTNPPTCKSVKDFSFKLKCRLKLFERLQVGGPTNLLAVASKYGLIFAGTPTGLQCIRSETILSLDVNHRHAKNISVYPRRTLQLGVQPSHISVNSEGELLAVAFVSSGCAVLFVYLIASFGSIDLIKKNEVRLSSTPGVTVSDMQWSTGLADILAVVMSDGSATSFGFKESTYNILGSIPPNSQSLCLCWSPKGKQVVIGTKNGSLTQYKPDLKIVKTFPPPQVQGGAGLAVVSVHWLSSYQFIAVYCSSEPSARACVMVVNVPKNSQPKYINYEDFCYGSNTARPEHYFIRQAAWNILIVGTTNSIEANILSMDGDSWVPWMLDDGGRAELPLTDDHQDVLNIGMGFDISPSQPIPIGENLTIDPMPLLLMLSHEGVLCCFQAINSMQGAPKICQPPLPFPDSSGLQMFNIPEAGDTSLSSPAEVEQKAPEYKGLGEQARQGTQPSISSSSGNTFMGQISAPQSLLAQAPSPFGMNLSFGQQSSAQSLSFGQQSSAQSLSFGQPSSAQSLSFGQPPSAQPLSFGQQPSSAQSFSLGQPGLGQTTMNQAQASPLSKFSLATSTATNQVQPSSVGTSGQVGQTLGGFGLSRPANQMFSSTSVPSFSAPQTSWPTVMNQSNPLQKPTFAQPAVASSMQSTVPLPQSSGSVQQSLAQPQSQLLQALSQPQSQLLQALSQPNLSARHQTTAPLVTQPLQNIQPHTVPLTSQENSSLLNQQSIVNRSTINQFQPDQVNKNPQTQSQNSSTPQLSTESVAEPADASQQRTKLATVAEVEEEPDETEIMKEEKRIALCQELLHTFSADMEQKQRDIKYTSSQTEYNMEQSKCKDQVILEIENLMKFEEELKETGAPNQDEVNAIGSSVLEIFGWYEKIKAKERMTKSPGYIELMESQDLDPITKNHLNNIDRYVYYLESQIKLAKTKLSALWDNIGSQNFEVPVMEVIYQSLVAQMNILAAKRAVVDSCEAKMKKINKNRVPRNPRRYAGELELSTLAERLLETRISDTDLLQNTSLRNASNNYILLSKRMAKKSLNEDKVSALHQWHKNHKVITTKVTKKNAIVANSDISKDETFCRIISPNKQSTPYRHTTPKKVSTSIPRKSLFTLTSNMSTGNLDTTEVSLGVSKLDIENNADSEEKQAPTLSNTTDQDAKTKSETTASSIDNILKNNLSSTVSKVAEINKIEGIQNTVSTSATLPTQRPKTASSLSSANSNDVIPTPAAFKAVQPPKGKGESIISTSWGNQTPVFSQSFFSPSTNMITSTKSSAPISSVSIYSGSSGANRQVTSSSASMNLFPINSSGGHFVIQVGNQLSTPPSSKSVPQPNTTTSANSLFLPTTQNNTQVASSLPSTEKDRHEPISTIATAVYTPTAMKPTTNSNASFSFTPTAASLPSTISAPTYINISPVSHTTTSSTSNLNTILSVPSPNQFSFASNSFPTSATNSFLTNSATPVTLFGGVTSPISSSATLSKTVSTPSSSDPSTVTISLVTPPNPQIPVTPETSNIVPTATVSETETIPKSSTPAWTQGNIFGGTASSSNPRHPLATSPSTTTPSIFGISSILGSFQNSQASSQSYFAGPSGSSSVSSTPITSSSFVTTSNGSAAEPVATTTYFGSANSVAANTPAYSISSASTASIPQHTSSTSASNFGIVTATNSAPVVNFGTAIATATTTNTTTTTTTATTAAAAQLLFSSPATTNAQTVFGSPPATSSSAFASPSAVTSSTPLFSAPSVSAAASSTFESVIKPATTTPSIFGGTPATTSSGFGSTTASIFANTPKTTASIFGTPTTSGSFFGSNSVFGGTNIATTSSVFGAANTKTTSTVFGATNTTTTPSVFGSANTTTPSIFGASNTTTSSSVFGTASTTTSSSVFGAANTTTTSIFGAAITTTSTAFGSPAVQGNSIFGATVAAALSSTSFFGLPVTTSSSSFGNQPAASIFAGTSSFSTPSTTNSFFLKGISSPTSTTANLFGSSANAFGATTTASGSSIFGGSSFQQKSPPFGQSTGSVFGQTTSSGGGGNFGSSGGSLFGGTSSFGTPSPQGNLFQSGGAGNIFGAAANASPFSGGSQTAGQAGFGSPPSFQTAQTPVFGGQSTFGAPPTFGASPGFGGSPGKVFGSTPPANAPAFGSPTQQSSTFENLASQDTLSFGNLAQQQTFPTSSFGGSSFSSWR